MAYNRLVMSGTIGAGGEIWSTGVNFIPDVGPAVISPGDLAAWAESAAVELEAGLGTVLNTGVSANGTIDEVRAYYYPSNDGPAQFVGIAPCDYVGSSTSNNPLPTSMVFSLLTATAGRSFRGRMYWPALSLTINTSGRFPSSVMTSAATDAANLLTALAGAVTIATDLTPAVVSKTRNLVTPVTQIRVGDVPDTQRRRRDALVEAYSTASI